jgi:metal-sulfur cluster biosynthetic enzyme
MSFDEACARAALKNVEDPEAGMNIVDLGLVYASPSRRAPCAST